MKILIEMEQNDKITKKELKNAIIDILKCYDVTVLSVKYFMALSASSGVMPS